MAEIYKNRNVDSTVQHRELFRQIRNCISNLHCKLENSF